MANPSLKCIPEFIRFSDNKHPIVQHRENPNTVAGMLLTTKHLFLRNPHINTFLR